MGYIQAWTLHSSNSRTCWGRQGNDDGTFFFHISHHEQPNTFSWELNTAVVLKKQVQFHIESDPCVMELDFNLQVSILKN